MTIYTVFKWCDDSDYGRECSLIGVFSDSEKAEKCKEIAKEQIKADCKEQVFNDEVLGDLPYCITIEAYTLNRFILAHSTDNEGVYDLNDKGLLRDCNANFLNNEEKY